ncbi:aminomethyl-transferring glycine dehydrogenase subunit GcvPA [Clostridium sp. Cult2]|uniref:aminomethyl-transferring glycine dehydrogenase subunit GcvPA n=1 Tax=Clostridium sp. Cult2 TaxID=2079003 RepID=UPI001F0112BF|nr:aminomethyl-transferring glycine dehydrogenase subunit GcvPA [Clostridium sp. Cult2]MCF6465833.1 aminomethyl-transferring glycine dehydrogenase [Clostridium sp. Cult2]
MKKDESIIYPYIPNSVPQIKEEMLKNIGVDSIEELYDSIPEDLRFNGKMNIPKPLLSEIELARHVKEILSKNKTCSENINFLGGGCWQHYIPSICDEIGRRGEFLTAYSGDTYEEHGKYQALFEYASMMAELLDMDIVNVPTYDWGQAASTAIRMASRITGKSEILISRTISPDRLKIIRNYCKPDLKIILVDYDNKTGQMNLDDLKAKITSETAAIYLENPSYLGFIEEQGEKISKIIHESSGLCLVGVDPISLGVIKPPSHYGADIVCGDIQPLGIHMNYGGGHGGFISTFEEEKYMQEYPNRLYGIAPTSVEGEFGFGDVAFERTSLASREKAKEYVGTAAGLWGIIAGVYLAVMGPRGMEELGKLIIQNSMYAAKQISKINNVFAPVFSSTHFKEFIVDFNHTNKKVKEINKELLNYGIFGGKDLSDEFPELGQCALYCVTEVHTKNHIDKLVNALTNILK